jgi:Transposase DDE domain
MASWNPSPVPDPSPLTRPDPDHPVTVGALMAFLRTMLAALEPDRRTPPGRGRPRVLPMLALWGGLLVCVLEGFTRQAALWRLLTVRGLWDYPRFALSDQAIYHGLARAPGSALADLFGQVTRVLAERLAGYQDLTLAPFATGVYAVDESTLDRVARVLPVLRDVPNGDRRLLPGKLSAVFDLRRQQFRHVEHQPDPCQNEKVAARRLLAALGEGALILADLGYFGFAWFDWLTDRRCWWVSRLRAKTSYTVLHPFYAAGTTFDGLVWLGAHRADRAKHAVRLVRFTVGTATYAYLTNVLDPTRLPPREIARLYARRWDLELAFKAIKRYLGLHLLWSAKESVILHQVWAVLILAQILHALRLEIAGRAGVEPFEVSLPLLVEYAPRFARDGQDPVAAFVRDGRAAGFLRPSRRLVTHAPDIPPEGLVPAPPGLVLIRKPHYAGKDCGSRHQ